MLIDSLTEKKCRGVTLGKKLLKTSKLEMAAIWKLLWVSSLPALNVQESEFVNCILLLYLQKDRVCLGINEGIICYQSPKINEFW